MQTFANMLVSGMSDLVSSFLRELQPFSVVFGLWFLYYTEYLDETSKTCSGTKAIHYHQGQLLCLVEFLSYLHLIYLKNGLAYSSFISENGTSG